MNFFKRLTALLLAAVLTIGLFPVNAYADEQETLTFHTTHINPYYADIISEEDLRPAAAPGRQTYDTPKYASTIEEAGAALRPHLVAREEIATVYYYTTEISNELFKEYARAILSAAYAHTGVPTEGDYILWHYDGCHIDGSAATSGEGYVVTITYTITYHTTAQQEAEVDAAVEKLLSDLDLEGKSDYEKAAEVYDYLCVNIRYDKTSSGTLKHSAYAALINKTAVCQGYASLLYRLMLELGIDCRFISGIGNGGPHGWNIIKLENLYYNADATWDEGQSTYNWFLKSPANFPDHARDEEYDTSSFHSTYPMASADYEPHSHNYRTAVTAPTCTEQGYTTYTCNCGHTYQDNFVTAAGHSFGSWYQTQAPTETATGLEQRDCEKCDHYETRVLEKLEPSDPSGTCGENLTWNFNETSGKLSVSGSGDMYGADQLGWTAFAGSIRSVEIGNGATSIGAYAFADCENLTDVQMPSTVMSIAYNAFENCSSLRAVAIPANVTEIAYGAFMDCSALTAVDIPDNVTEIAYSAFNGCTSLATVELPKNVMSISYRAFENCSSLSEVNFPASLASIQDEAFGSCTGLDALRFTGNAPEIRSNAFRSVTANAYYPASNTTWTEAVRQNYGGTLTWIAEGGAVTPENSCGENITWQFEESTGTLTISGKETMARSNGISIMDDYARPEDAPWFKYQDQIITIIIEGTVDSIGKNAFAGCSNLTTVIIEEGVSEIDSTAFSDCDALENCYFEGSEEQWEDLGADIGEAIVHTESAEPETHMETKTTVAPTCTEQGYDLYTCSCGTIRKDNFTDPTGHTWDEGTVTKQPTETENGIRTYTCTVCKDTKTEDIPYEAPATGPVRRIYGQDRIETALAVAAELKSVLKVDKFDAIILAAGGSGSDQTKFADALSGSYLATEKGAPILLYTKGNLSPKNLAFIEENLSDNGIIYLLGGNVSIPEEVEEALMAEGYTTKRLGGANRYDTNLVILEEAGIDEAKEILISSGRAFADSLSASSTGLPIMLVNGTNTALTNAQVQFLKSVKDKKITILGGTAAVSEALEAAIEEAVGTDVERIFGAARESTSAMIAEKYFADADTALIAYSKMYPDGLAGGVLANALHAPLLLTKAGSESIAREYIEESDISSGYVLGGTAVMSDDTARAVFGLDEGAVINAK